jgi:putative transposase
MSRPLRIEYPGALYHVTSRGNAQQQIYLSAADFEMFLRTLASVIKTHNFLCHAYCLMTNHYHLLIETPEGNLSTGMRDLNGIYTQNFNRRHDRVGHIFQGRYKAFLIEKDPYLLRVARYTVLNPVRAGLVEKPGDWSWSSYSATAGLSVPKKLLTTDWILKNFGDIKKEAEKNYHDFVYVGIEEDDPFRKLGKGGILGSPQFIDYIWDKERGSEELKEVPRDQRMIKRPTLDDLFSETMSTKDRNNIILFAKKKCAYSNKEIGDYLNIHYSTVSKVINSYNLPNSHPKT